MARRPKIAKSVRASPTGLKGAVAIVTGARGGLGRAIVDHLLSSGVRVAALDLKAPLGPRRSGNLLAIRADVTDETSVREAVAATIDRFGRLDILVNNAGRVGQGRVEDLSGETWDELLRVNLTSVFFCCKHAIPHLRRTRGTIVSMSSTNGLTGGSALSGPAYAAAKAGIIALTKNLARDLAKDGIRVNAIAPGPIDTPMLDRLGDSGKAALRASIPLGELGQPSDVADLVAFLASQGARHLTGVTITLSGGLVMTP